MIIRRIFLAFIVLALTSLPALAQTTTKTTATLRGTRRGSPVRVRSRNRPPVPERQEPVG